jgi:hypothetical protein
MSDQKKNIESIHLNALLMARDTGMITQRDMVELSQDFKKRSNAPKPEQKIFKEIPKGNVKVKLVGIKDNDLENGNGNL